MDVPIAANVLGTIGAICWSIQLIPQIVINHRRHHAAGLQPAMMMWWAVAGVPLGVYNIVSGFPVALQVQPQLLSLLSLATWIQCHHYQRRWPLARSLGVVLPVACALAGVEAGLVVALRHGVGVGTRWPLQLMAGLAAGALAAGVLRHYWDIWRWRTVRGISFLFVGIDAAGDLFSLVAVLFQPGELDVLGLVTYGVELALWLGVFACGGYFNLWPWLMKRSRMRAAGGGGENGESGSDAAAAAAQSESGDDGGVDTSVSGQGVAESSAVELHDLPSSTSVFRTPSCELALARSRTGGSRRSDGRSGSVAC
ncbi:pq loop repeat protein [Diplodia corticola]|uniref:Pq loop repeat protein n=1 Tax=Diplodia corticola TaxID=236234 RepID=A0A1J9RXV1_9PEZI|nr:pq loop repeat protein [Diplodia corticola]OJD33191.1 pq loop repeat protein [Diplodia corticola]